MSLFEDVRNYLSRRLEPGEPETWIDGGGSSDRHTFSGQTRTRDELETYQHVYEEGGPIAQLIDARSYMIFGTGTEFEAANDIETVIDGEEITLTEWLNEAFDQRDNLLPRIARDAYVYGEADAEIVETRSGGFSHVELINPKTLTPEFDDTGEITSWVQTINAGHRERSQSLDADQVAHFTLSKLGRQIGGISLIGRALDEVNRYATNQQSLENYLHRYGHPRRHVKVGRENGPAIDDIQLKKIRSRIRNLDADDDIVTGVDVNVDTIDEFGSADITNTTEIDLKKLAISMGVPLELADIGGDGMGTGTPAELRLKSFERQGNAEQDMLARQFVEQIVRPVIERYSPFPPDVNVTLQFEEIVTDLSDKANWMQTAQEVLTVDEIRAEFGYAPHDGPEDELGPPSEPSGGGGLFSNKDTPTREALIESQTESGTLITEGLGFKEKAAAEQKAEELGCSGAHKMERGGETWWMPCSSHESFEENKPTFTRTQSEGSDKSLEALTDLYVDIAWHENDSRELFQFDDEDIPKFAKQWLQMAVAESAVFGNIDTIPAGARENLEGVLMDSLETQHGWSINSLTENIQNEIPTLSELEAERIARTETQSIVAHAREIGYEERNLDEQQFRWVGPSDDRTTEICEAIKERSKEGVTMSELKEIVQEEGDGDREWTPHIQCRHTFVRTQGRENRAMADEIPMGNNNFSGGDAVMFGWEEGDPTTGVIVRGDSESITIGEKTVTGDSGEFVYLIELDNGALIAKPESEIRGAEQPDESDATGGDN